MRTSPHQPWASLPNPRIIRISEPAASRFKKPARTNSEHEGGNDRTLWGELGDEAAVRADFLIGGGWRIIHAGTASGPVGAPRTGIAGDFLRRAVERDLYPVDELRTIRWRKDVRAQAMRDHLAVWLYARRNVNRRALAALLDYDRKTIDRLYGKGKKMLELLEQINGKLDIVLERLRELNPTSEEIAATIEDLIADVLGEAA